MATQKIITNPNSPPGEDLLGATASLSNLFPEWFFHLSGEVDSTSAEARRQSLLMGGDAYPRVFLADFQNQGVGRRGKAWNAPPFTSILVTIMFPAAVFKLPQQLLPLGAGCWCLEGLDRLGLIDHGLKWPNDLLVKGQKIGGLLCETSAAALLIGCGLNLEQRRDQLPERLNTEPQATSVRVELEDQKPSRLVATITFLSAILENIEHPPNADWILRTYRSNCVSIGKSIAFKDPQLGPLVGVAEQVDESGALVVNVDGHGKKIVTSEYDPE